MAMSGNNPDGNCPPPSGELGHMKCPGALASKEEPSGVLGIRIDTRVPPSSSIFWVIKCEGSNPSDRLHAKAYLIEINGFEFAFLLHLMLKVLVLSNELSKALQRKEQDIVNAMVFLDLTKERLQKLREEGWKEFMDEAKLFYAVIDLQLQELNKRFDVVSGDLLLGMASLNPANSFANFDKERIMTLAKHYPNEFGGLKLRDLNYQLDTFIMHMRRGDSRFSDLKGISDLTKAMVDANLVETYSLVYLLMKLTLILPVATAMLKEHSHP
ncbi:uncharacterized protein LOC132057868 [Lycium ferocissimum]|uniref:uncharacterized protein LOC132057868 n=1 Tax=Lycium ferocissimum TaxID=112874 RepID=UPI002815A284|nr:uncharacterized protein LOC132057868 [Lycium ferocissimum]